MSTEDKQLWAVIVAITFTVNLSLFYACGTETRLCLLGGGNKEYCLEETVE